VKIAYSCFVGVLKSISEQQLYEPRDGPLKRSGFVVSTTHRLMKDTSDVLAVGRPFPPGHAGINHSALSKYRSAEDSDLDSAILSQDGRASPREENTRATK